MSADSHIGHEEELFTLIVRGDQAAFSTVFSLYRYRLLFYASRLLPDRGDMEDVVADSFLALWKSRERITSDDHIRHFLFATVRKRAYSLMASRGRKEKWMESMKQQVAEEDEQFMAHRVQEEMLYLMNMAAKSLPGDCRRIFELYCQGERTPDEIAHLMQIAPATVRSQKRRAIQLIQAWMKKNGSLLSLLVNLFLSIIAFLKKI